MQLRTVLRRMRHFWVSAVLVALVTAIVAGVGHYVASAPKYTSEADVVFTSRAFDKFNDPAAATAYTTALVSTYSNHLQSASVLQPIGDSLNPKVPAATLKQTVTFTPNVLMLQLSYESGDQETAQKVITDLRDALRQEVSKAPVVGGTPVLSIVSDPVTTSQVAGTSRSASRSAVIGVLVGVLVGLVYLFLRALVDGRVRSTEDISQYTDSSFLGRLSAKPGLDAAADSLAHNLTFVPALDGARTVLLAPTVGGEPAARAVAVSAQSLARDGHDVVVVDTDLSRRTLSAALGVDDEAGLSDVLAGHRRLDEVLRGGGDQPVVLPAGSQVANGTELLATPRFDEVLADLAHGHEIVLLAGAPEAEGPQSLTVASRVAGYVPVVGLGKVSTRALADHLELAEAAGARVAGIVLTGASRG